MFVRKLVLWEKGRILKNRQEFLGECMPSLGETWSMWEKMSCIWEESGLSGRKGHFDGSKCDLEEHQVEFLGRNGWYF